MAPGVLTPEGRKQTFPVSPHSQDSLDQAIFDALHSTAMRDATVLFYNTPLLAMQKERGIIPKRVKSLEDLYQAMLKKAFEDKRSKLALPKSSSREQIAKALAQHMN